jgi:hypothetical protein
MGVPEPFADERWLASVHSADAAFGSVDPARLQREKVIRTLTKRPAIAARLAASLATGTFVINREDHVRLMRVLSKIGRALWAYETAETALVDTNCVRYALIGQLTSRGV